MAIVKTLTMALIIVSASVSLGGIWVEAREHHVVGGDLGWDPSTDIGYWASSKIFRVGDEIWFSYSAAHGMIAEVRTKDEYEACDVSNPIKMYTDGVNGISLDGEGIRYFASSNMASCKSGLKLQVEVMPHDTSDALKVPTPEASASDAVAAEPTYSGATHLPASFTLLLAGFFICFMGM
uniref:Phytocyanin domain-containing protein n=1 Tax=Rhizophora mucronata TaxID=61149 RepID=A0A2P2QLV8_RHIMU